MEPARRHDLEAICVHARLHPSGRCVVAVGERVRERLSYHELGDLEPDLGLETFETDRVGEVLAAEVERLSQGGERVAFDHRLVE